MQNGSTTTVPETKAANLHRVHAFLLPFPFLITPPLILQRRTFRAAANSGVILHVCFLSDLTSSSFRFSQLASSGGSDLSALHLSRCNKKFRHTPSSDTVYSSGISHSPRFSHQVFVISSRDLRRLADMREKCFRYFVFIHSSLRSH